MNNDGEHFVTGDGNVQHLIGQLPEFLLGHLVQDTLDLLFDHRTGTGILHRNPSALRFHERSHGAGILFVMVVVVVVVAPSATTTTTITATTSTSSLIGIRTWRGKRVSSRPLIATPSLVVVVVMIVGVVVVATASSTRFIVIVVVVIVGVAVASPRTILVVMTWVIITVTTIIIVILVQSNCHVHQI